MYATVGELSVNKLCFDVALITASGITRWRTLPLSFFARRTRIAGFRQSGRGNCDAIATATAYAHLGGSFIVGSICLWVVKEQLHRVAVDPDAAQYVGPIALTDRTPLKVRRAA
jgi:hypothetical protein